MPLPSFPPTSSPTVTPTTPGLATPGMYSSSLRFGVPVGDADTTVSPGTDSVSAYEIPAGLLTDNRIVTIDHSGAGLLTAQLCVIVILPQSHTVTVKNNLGGTVATVTANAKPVAVEAYNAGSTFLLNVCFYAPG